MPDQLLGRGRLSAFLFSKWNSALLSESLWKQYLKSPDSLAFRKAGASIQQSGNLSSRLNELAETFPIASSFMGSIQESQFKELDEKRPLVKEDLLDPQFFDSKPVSLPFLFPVCTLIQEEKIPHTLVMGRTVWDYSVFRSDARKQKGLRPLPFEFICHFRLTDTSLKRLKVDSVSLPKTASLQTLQTGVEWDFPVIELGLAQNPFDKRIGLSDALWMTGLAPEQLQTAILTAAWIASFMRFQMKKVTLNSLKLRFAIQEDGAFVLNDSFLLEDLFLEKDGHSFHTDLSLEFYQKTSWFESVLHARHHAETFGLAEWRRAVAEPAPFLDSKVKARLESDQQELLKCLSE